MRSIETNDSRVISDNLVTAPNVHNVTLRNADSGCKGKVSVGFEDSSQANASEVQPVGRNCLAVYRMQAPAKSMEQWITEINQIRGLVPLPALNENRASQSLAVGAVEWQFVACQGQCQTAMLLNFFLVQQIEYLTTKWVELTNASYPYHSNTHGKLPCLEVAFKRPIRILHRFSRERLRREALFLSADVKSVAKFVDQLTELGYLSSYRSGFRMHNGQPDRTPQYSLHTDRLVEWLRPQRALGNPFEVSKPVTWYLPRATPEAEMLRLQQRVNVVLVDQNSQRPTGEIAKSNTQEHLSTRIVAK